MHVRSVRMGMDEWFVAMPMGVRFASRIFRAVFMLMVLIMHVWMRVSCLLVGVGMFVMLGEMQPDPDAHDHARQQ